MENMKCATCGHEIKNPQTMISRNNQTYCSQACADKGMEKA